MHLRVKVLAAIVAFVAVPALAHEQSGRAMGVIESITPDKIVVRADDGHGVTFTITGETRFVRGDRPAKAGDARVGERAVVHGKKAGDALEAVQVKLGAQPSGK
jgi:hypothetical protein